MRDAEVYLETLGVPAGLPVLTLAFRGRGVAGRAPQRAAATRFSTPNPRRVSPTTSPRRNRLDRSTSSSRSTPTPPRRGRGRRHLPGASGPYLHGLWIRTPRRNPKKKRKRGKKDEPSDTESLRAVVPYRPPAPPRAAAEHRYVFLAFEGEFDPASRGARPEEAIAASVAKGRARWDAEAFARENASTLKPVAATFFRCAALD